MSNQSHKHMFVKKIPYNCAPCKVVNLNLSSLVLWYPLMPVNSGFLELLVVWESLAVLLVSL